MSNWGSPPLPHSPTPHSLLAFILHYNLYIDPDSKAELELWDYSTGSAEF